MLMVDDSNRRVDMRKAKGIEYEEHGQGEPVLLIHGAFISDALSLVAREPALAERNRVIWYRRRGYGGSEPGSAPFSIAEQARDAQALLAHLGVEQAHVVGHSGGGVIATELALQAPKLVRSLAVLEPAIFSPALAEAFPVMLEPAMEAYRSGNVGGAVDLFMDMVAPAPDWRGDLAKVLPAGPEQADNDAPVTFDAELADFAGWAFDGERASRLSGPVVYVWGSESGPLIEALRDHFLSLVPKAESVELPGVDHSMNTQNPKLVAGAIAEFLARQP
jgi:pimeloyl-ACP methyl ester carboxylesterase